MKPNRQAVQYLDGIVWWGLLAAAGFSLVDYVLRASPLSPAFAAGWDEALLGGLLAAWAVRMVLNKNWEFRPSLVTLPLAVMLTLAVLSVVVNRVPTFLGVEAIRVLLQGSLFYLVGYNLIRSQRQVRILVIIMLICVTVIAVYGIYQFASGLETPDRWLFGDAEAGIRTRVFSTMGNPNALGGYLILMAPVALALFFKSAGWGQKIIYGSIFMILSICLVFTFSRGAWLGFALSLVLLGWMVDRRILWLLLLGLAASPFILPQTIKDRILVLFSPEYLRISAKWGRIFFWKQAFERMITHPWLGVGPGTFGDAVARRHLIPDSIWVDNHYLKVGAEIGVSGLLAFLWLMGRSLMAPFNRGGRWLKDPFQIAVLAGGTAGLVAVIVQNVTVSVFEVLFVSTYWWFLLGVMTAMVHLNWQPPRRSDSLMP